MNQTKIDEFLKEYGELTKKHGVDFVSYPMYHPDKEGGFKLVVQTQAIEVQEKPKDSFIAK
jgi:hypothetical protein